MAGRPSRASVYARLDQALTELNQRLGGLPSPKEAQTAALVTEDLSVTALRHAARRGRLDAVQESDGVWRSSHRAVDAYRKARHQRRKGEEEK